MYPVVSLNARVMTEKDVAIGGYQFSKNVGLLFYLLICIVLYYNLLLEGVETPLMFSSRSLKV